MRGVVAAAHGAVLCHHLFGLGFLLRLFLLFLLLLQRLYHPVYGCVAVGLAHGGEGQQRVLQVDGVGIGHQAVEYLRAVGELLVVLAFFVEHAHGGAVTALGVAEFLQLPVDIAQTEQQHTVLHSVAGGFLVSFLIGADGVGGVVLRHIDIAHGVVHLVQILLIVVAGGHALQARYHLLAVALGGHLGHGDTGVEGQLVGRVLLEHLAVGFVGLVLPAQLGQELPHEEPFAGPLLAAHLMLDHLAQVGDGLLVLMGVDMVVGVGVVPFFPRVPVDRVALHVAHHVFGVVEPFLLYVALGQPGACLAVNGGLRLVEAAHVVEGGGGLVESTFVELGASHQHPGFPHEGVVFLSVQPFYVLGRLAAVLGPLGFFLYAVQLDDFLALLDGFVEVARPQCAAFLIAHGVEGYYFGVVVLVAVLLVE